MAATLGNKSIAVVGSGLSGLTAACLLHKLGFAVTVFEAAERIGGRTFSVYDGRTQIALGAMWLHGGASNPLYPLVKRLGLLDNERWQQLQDNLPDLCDQSQTYEYDWKHCWAVTDCGDTVDLELARQAKQTASKLIAEAYELSSQTSSECYGDRMGAYLESHFPKHCSSIDTVYGAALHTFSQFYANVEGVHSLNDLSIVGGAEYTGGADGQCLVVGGMARLAESLAAMLPGECVRLRAPVDRVNLTQDGCASLLVNSEWLRFDHALVTVSLGVLQAGRLIEPSLVTAERQSALNQMQLGLVDKIFVRFALPFAMPNGCKHLWIIKQRLHRCWLDGLTAVSLVNTTGDTILLWLAGNYAAEMEQQTDEQVERILVPFLERAMRCSLPRVAKLWRTSFGQNKNFLGSYSSFKPGCNPGAIGELAKPIEFGQGVSTADVANKPAICFAGEHTSEKNYATVQGAFLSGVREARRIAKYYRLEAAAKSDLAAMI